MADAVKARRIDSLRIGRRHVHRNLAAQRLKFVGVAGRFERHDHADAAKPIARRIVHIARHRALADRKPGSAAQCHVFADLGDGFGNGVRGGAVADPGGKDLLDVRARVERHVGNHLDQSLEQIVTRHEIGLGIDLNQHALVGAQRGADESFGRHSIGFLGRLGQSLLAQPIDRSLESPAVSDSAALQSIMPAPVFSRSSLTMVAVMFAVIG